MGAQGQGSLEKGAWGWMHGTGCTGRGTQVSVPRTEYSGLESMGTGCMGQGAQDWLLEMVPKQHQRCGGRSSSVLPARCAGCLVPPPVSGGGEGLGAAGAHLRATYTGFPSSVPNSCLIWASVALAKQRCAAPCLSFPTCAAQPESSLAPHCCPHLLPAWVKGTWEKPGLWQ